MTKKDKHTEELSLEEELELLQQKEKDEEEQDIFSLKQRIARLEVEKVDMTEITKRIQYDYINLKTDFDRMQRIFSEKEKSMEADALVKHFNKILPVLNQLKTSLSHVDDDKSSDPFVIWVRMVYDNFLKSLKDMWIKPILSIGLEPDSFFHEPLSTMPVESKKMKWKIVQEFQQGFYLEKDWQKTVILISKVIVWA